MVGTRRIVTLKGKALTLLGSEIKAGQKAPDFKLLTTDSEEVQFSQSRGKIRLLSVLHSLDTQVCDPQTQRFKEEVAKLKEVVIYAISMDLPFAQARYCGAHDISNLKTLSYHREVAFGRAYGVLIEELRLLSRAIFIIGRNDTVRYVESVPEATQHPDYDKTMESLKNMAISQ